MAACGSILRINQGSEYEVVIRVFSSPLLFSLLQNNQEWKDTPRRRSMTIGGLQTHSYSFRYLDVFDQPQANAFFYALTGHPAVECVWYSFECVGSGSLKYVMLRIHRVI